MLRYAGLLIVISFAPNPAFAQDIAPVISPGQAAEGVFHRSRMEEQAARTRNRPASPRAQANPAPGTRAFQAKACANRPKFRAQYGADHPKLKQLEALCAASGY